MYLAALPETLDVCNQRFQIVCGQVGGRRHPACCHLGGRMFQKLRYLIWRILCPDSDEGGSRSRADPTITMARVTGTRLENCFPLRCERISKGHIRGSKRSGRKLRLKWLARVLVFFGFLLGQLLGDSRVMRIQILAPEAEAKESE